MKRIKQLIIVLAGSALVAFGLINFAVLNRLGDGGFTGITLILYRTFGISTAVTNLCLNLPVLVIGYRQFNKETFWLTIFGTLSLSGFLRFFEVIGPLAPPLGDEMILAVVAYGVIVGGGMGMIFHQGATTGGVDIVAKLVKDRFGVPMAKTILIFDSAVVGLSLLTFLTFTHGVYTLIGIYLYSLVLTRIQEGFQGGYKVFIHSQKAGLFRQKIMDELSRGVTIFYGEGGFSHERADILMVAINKKQLRPLKQLIEATDPQAFVTVSPTYETIGEGFTYFSK